jgi:hypothetical protein
MERTLRTDADAIEQAERDLTEAQRQHQVGTIRSLHRSNEAHRIAQRDLQVLVREADDALGRVADRGCQHAYRARELIETVRITLTAEEEASAARQAPVISNLVETATFADVRNEPRASLIANDKASLVLFATHVPTRLDKKPETPDGHWPAQDEGIRSEIFSMLSQARERLWDQRYEPLRRQADQLLERAGAIQSAIARREAAARLAADVTAGHKVPWPER